MHRPSNAASLSPRAARADIAATNVRNTARRRMCESPDLNTREKVTKLRLKPPSDDDRSARESSLLGGRCAAAKTASKASPAKTCFISPEHGFRRCLADGEQGLEPADVSSVLCRWGGPDELLQVGTRRRQLTVVHQLACQVEQRIVIG